MCELLETTATRLYTERGAPHRVRVVVPEVDLGELLEDAHATKVARPVARADVEGLRERADRGVVDERGELLHEIDPAAERVGTPSFRIAERREV